MGQIHADLHRGRAIEVKRDDVPPMSPQPSFLELRGHLPAWWLRAGQGLRGEPGVLSFRLWKMFAAVSALSKCIPKPGAVLPTISGNF